MLNGGSMIWGFCVYFVYMIPLETDVLRKHRFQKCISPFGFFLGVEIKIERKLNSLHAG